MQVRNRIYERVFNRKWVEEHLPGAELRRQQAAFRRGVLRMALVSGVILALISTLAIAAVINGRRRELRGSGKDRRRLIRPDCR